MYAPHFAAALAKRGSLYSRPGTDCACVRRHRACAAIELLRRLVSFAGFCCNSATLFASAFFRRGKPVFVGIWLAVFSHFLLDFPVHPKRLALAPLSGVYLGWDLLAWGSRPGWLGAIDDWWLQSAVLLVLLLVYASGARKSDLQPAAVAASFALLIGIQLMTLFPCIGY